MRWCGYLAGDYTDLAEQELCGVLAASTGDVELDRSGRLVRFAAPAAPFDRLALTRYVAREQWTGHIDELQAADLQVNGGYAVRCTVVDGDADPGKVESVVGDALSVENNHVDLDDPETVIRVFVADEMVYMGQEQFRYDPGPFRRRRNQHRPFSSPVSLAPRLARALVNMARVSRGDTICDPCCGTGGILLEACLMGMNAVGGDIDEAMLQGCRENLASFGCEAELVVSDLSDLPARSGRVDAVVADLPYGRASPQRSDDIVASFLNAADSMTDGRVVFVIDRPSAAGLEPVAELYVHRSLSRYVYAVEAGTGEGI